MDKKRISNINQKVKRDIEPFGHNFEAVVSFKEYSDKRNLLYIFKVNDRRGNPDKSSVKDIEQKNSLFFLLDQLSITLCA